MSECVDVIGSQEVGICRCCSVIGLTKGVYMYMLTKKMYTYILWGIHVIRYGSHLWHCGLRERLTMCTTLVHGLLQHCCYPVDISLTYLSKTLQEGCKYVLKLDTWTHRVHVLSREAYWSLQLARWLSLARLYVVISYNKEES